MNCDTIVLGAGIVGVSTALHLHARGRQVTLVDLNDPGEGTSYGNAGLIERSSVVPYAFPREFLRLLRYGLNRESDVRYSPCHLPRIAPWLLSFWRHSAPKPLAAATQALRPLIERCVLEHDALVEQAGLEHLIRANGWIEIFRCPRALRRAQQEAQTMSAYGLHFELLDAAQLHAREANLSPAVCGGVHWLDPKTVTDPGNLTKGYAALFSRRGGRLLKGDARSLRTEAGAWQLMTAEGLLSAREVVVALGPESNEVLNPLGYRLPLAVKRGYHMHYAAERELKHSLCDTQGGYVLAPMDQGIRLTTGIEFAAADAPVNEIQLRRAEALARQVFPLGERLDPQPWLGKRPCLPDMLPVIGPAPNHPGLWLNFGHAHHGLTLGPVSGRLLAEMMTGEQPFTDPAAFSAERFS
jgi:D-amino-acid dehydrogenase